MSIEEVKDIKKLQRWLKSALDELKYIKECCRNAGKELEKNSFAWDSKEKNLVIQAIELNEKFEASQAHIKELEEEIKNLKEEIDYLNTQLAGIDI